MERLKRSERAGERKGERWRVRERERGIRGGQESRQKNQHVALLGMKCTLLRSKIKCRQEVAYP